MAIFPLLRNGANLTGVPDRIVVPLHHQRYDETDEARGLEFVLSWQLNRMAWILPINIAWVWFVYLPGLARQETGPLQWGLDSSLLLLYLFCFFIHETRVLANGGRNSLRKIAANTHPPSLLRTNGSKNVKR